MSTITIHSPMLMLGSHDSAVQQVVSTVTKQQYSCQQVLQCTGVVSAVNHLSGVPRNFFRGGVQQTQLTEGRENRDLGAVAP
jgi:hypothetical protein